MGLPSCSGDNEPMMPVPDANLTGVWTFVADGNSPPTTLACSNGHQGMGNMALCSPFDLNLQLNGTVYMGASTQMYCGADFSASVAVSGNSIAGEIVADDGTNVQRLSFTGTVSGSVGIIDPGTFAEDGLSGNCTTSGFYHALR